MLNLGVGDVMLVLVVALAFLGPSKLGQMSGGVRRFAAGRDAAPVRARVSSDHLLVMAVGLSIGLFIALVAEPATREWPSLMVFITCALLWALCMAYRVPRRLSSSLVRRWLLWRCARHPLTSQLGPSVEGQVVRMVGGVEEVDAHSGDFWLRLAGDGRVRVRAGTPAARPDRLRLVDVPRIAEGDLVEVVGVACRSVDAHVAPTGPRALPLGWAVVATDREPLIVVGKSRERPAHA
jgi:hypothetical protein